MPCYHPLTGYRSKTVNPATGKRSIVFNQSEGFKDLCVTLPCGRCIGCRLEYSRQWACRAVHEMKSHPTGCSLTLTYDDEHLPPGGTLQKEDHQKFMKLLRKKYAPKEIRVFYCGEYGEKHKRPHYHTCLFNHDFEDKKWNGEMTETGYKLYESEELNKLWKLGRARVAELNFETAAYAARYMTKKIKGPKAAEHYKGRLPEYADASRGRGEVKGLGYAYCKKWLYEIYPADEVMIEKMGKYIAIPPPKYYDKILEKTDPELYSRVMAKRKAEQWALRDNPDSTPERLNARRQVHEAQGKMLKRTIE